LGKVTITNIYQRIKEWWKYNIGMPS
jgi:hypothetical protein